MASIEKIDQVEGARLETDISGISRASRIATVKDVSAGSATVNDPLALKNAVYVGGMPQVGEAHPGDPKCKVVHHVVTGLSNDKARVEIQYESTPIETGGAPIGVYTLTDSTQLMNIPADTLPVGTFNAGTPFSCSFTDPNNSNNVVTSDIITLNILRPIRTITVAGMVTKQPTDAVRLAVGSVNQGSWQGLAQGYWLFSEFNSNAVTFSTDNLPTQWNVSATFITKGYEPWSYFGIMFDPRTGKKVKLTQNQIAQVLNPPYQANNVISPANLGCLRADPYNMVQFFPLFGI